MNYRYLKLGFQFFFIVIFVGVMFIYLKAKDIIPPIVRFDNFDYKQSLIQKSVSLVEVSYVGDEAFVKVKELYVYGLSKLKFPLKDFKRDRKIFLYNKSVGLKGNLLPVYINITISNIRLVNEYEFSIPQSEINSYISSKKRVIKSLGSFTYIKDLKGACGIVELEDKSKVILCNIKRKIDIEKGLTEGVYLISPLSIMKLPDNINGVQIFNNKNLGKLNGYIESIVLSDIYLEKTISEKIKNDFINFVKTVFKLKRFNIKEIKFQTKG